MYVLVAEKMSVKMKILGSNGGWKIKNEGQDDITTFFGTNEGI